MTLANALTITAQRTACCLLCRKPRPQYTGQFIPDTPELWPGPPVVSGKERSFWFGLCRKCYRRRDRSDAVEVAILNADRRGAVGH